MKHFHQWSGHAGTALRIFLLLVLATAFAQGQTTEQAAKSQVSFEEKLLAKTSPEMFRGGRGSRRGPQIVFSPDGRRVAYVAKKGNKWFIIIGDQKSEEFDSVQDIVFSPDGQKVAFHAWYAPTHVNDPANVKNWDQGKSFVIVGDKKGEQFDGVRDLLFSPDSRRLAYIAEKHNKHLVVVDDKQGEIFDQIECGPFFSADSQQVAYAARKGMRMWAVVDDKKGEEYGFVGGSKSGGFYGEAITFSPDSSQVAYVAMDAGKRFVVIGDKKGEVSGSVDGPLVFSPDGRQVAYRAKRPGEHYKCFVVVGNQKSEEFDRVWPNLVFSPDGKKLAFGALKGDELWWKVMNVR